MTRGQAVFNVSRKTGLDDTAGSDELILMQRWWNDAIVEVLKKTHCYVATGTIAVSANVGDYRIASTFVAILDLEFVSSGANDYERVTMDEIMDLRRASSSKRAFATQGDFLRINPVPTASDTINVVYVPYPTLASADGTTGGDSNDPSNTVNGGIQTQWHRALEYYMLWQAAEYDDKRIAEAPKDYRQQFEDECRDIRKGSRNLGSRRLNGGRVGYPGTSRLSSGRNDVYPVWS